MVARGKALPARIKPDSIIEAIFEVRFETSVIPEVLFGRLSEFGPWASFQQRHMPAYSIPPQVRALDPNLRYQPVFELIDAEKPSRALRLGPQVASYHRIGAYGAWSQFRPELDHVVDGLFQKGDRFTAHRLGLRYLNALRSDLHGINAVTDLELSAVIAGDVLKDRVNLNFLQSFPNKTVCAVRIATADLVQGPLPPKTTVFVDVDVYTEEGFQAADSGAVRTWIKDAHEIERQEFFHLLKDATIKRLEVT